MPLKCPLTQRRLRLFAVAFFLVVMVANLG